ncbi:MAG: T9SS type A sorting domain-containing protein [Melioribacteraceae bacterium]|nr:T9SS type A sorting domain-containing protein [Melioribacteraceae bacterium]MCF8264159.1 T9SS type A sorting domain-containing protein [Melioribacteraceae bacterium]
MEISHFIKKSVLTIFVFILSGITIIAQTRAFPSAEGYGQFTTGGRGGDVYIVTNLDDSGPGSLREAVSKSGPRTVVFAVSGTIQLNSKLSIRNDDLTIAGQTAPGDGICIAGYDVQLSASNVIIRYIRFRMGDENKNEQDAFWGKNEKDIIIDHCSMSWSIDEASSFYDNENFTLQWCIISESLYNSFHTKGEHGYGGIWGGWGATFHHNLLAHHTSRNPRFNGSRYTNRPDLEIVEFANNVIYNWGFNSAYGGEGGRYNLRSNYYKYGPATSSSKKNRIVEPSDTTGVWYISDNYIYDYPAITSDNWNGGVQGSNANYLKNKNITEPFETADLVIHSAEEAFNLVLDNAGVTFPKRDSIDTRIVEETRTGTANYSASFQGGLKGIIDSQTDVGGWPLLYSLPAPLDSDQDGMPDEWENSISLNPNDSNDRNLLNTDGYTMLEVYLNQLLGDTVTTDVNEHAVIPGNFTLNQNYPNPFNPSTTISFDLNTDGFIKLGIYNVLGELVDQLISDYRSAGSYRVNWSPNHSINSNVSSSIYFARLTNTSSSQMIKMIYLK